jgi:N-acetylglucosaminyldiphosphoundecaprenol N-acetyl-beta-D-mannosaminyltransferase
LTEKKRPPQIDASGINDSVGEDGSVHPRSQVLGVPVSVLTLDEAVATIDGWIASGERKYVCTLDVHALMESQSAPDVRNIYRSAAMVTPDGMPLVWLLHRSGYHTADRVCGPDLMPALFRHSQGRGHRHFLYGSSDTTLSLLQEELGRNFPGAKIVGSYSPPYRALTREEEREVDRVVNAADPDIVWVGLGAPKQDRWMAAHRGALKAPVLIGVGAAFDMLAGKITRAPRFLQRTGCEWMFRLAQEPRRLSRRYLESNSKFAMMLIGEKLHLTKRNADA